MPQLNKNWIPEEIIIEIIKIKNSCYTVNSRERVSVGETQWKKTKKLNKSVL